MFELSNEFREKDNKIHAYPTNITQQNNIYK